MRIHLRLKTTTQSLIPFDHQHLLTGTIHKWLGRNNEHGNISLYSFSRLYGGKAQTNGLIYDRTVTFFFSTHDHELIKKLISGIQNDPNLFYGLFVTDITIQHDPDLSCREIFFPASPIFMKRAYEDRIDHILYDDPRANLCLIETLKTKMKKAGIIDDSLEVYFDKTYPRACSKKITYKGIQNRASWCPVVIKGSPETKLFAWNVGLGNSTGIGFGSIK